MHRNQRSEQQKPRPSPQQNGLQASSSASGGLPASMSLREHDNLAVEQRTCSNMFRSSSETQTSELQYFVEALPSVFAREEGRKGRVGHPVRIVRAIKDFDLQPHTAEIHDWPDFDDASIPMSHREADETHTFALEKPLPAHPTKSDSSTQSSNGGRVQRLDSRSAGERCIAKAAARHALANAAQEPSQTRLGRDDLQEKRHRRRSREGTHLRNHNSAARTRQAEEEAKMVRETRERTQQRLEGNLPNEGEPANRTKVSNDVVERLVLLGHRPDNIVRAGPNAKAPAIHAALQKQRDVQSNPGVTGRRPFVHEGGSLLLSGQYTMKERRTGSGSTASGQHARNVSMETDQTASSRTSVDSATPVPSKARFSRMRSFLKRVSRERKTTTHAEGQSAPEIPEYWPISSPGYLEPMDRKLSEDIGRQPFTEPAQPWTARQHPPSPARSHQTAWEDLYCAAHATARSQPLPPARPAPPVPNMQCPVTPVEPRMSPSPSLQSDSVLEHHPEARDSLELSADEATSPRDVHQSGAKNRRWIERIRQGHAEGRSSNDSMLSFKCSGLPTGSSPYFRSGSSRDSLDVSKAALVERTCSRCDGDLTSNDCSQCGDCLAAADTGLPTTHVASQARPRKASSTYTGKSGVRTGSHSPVQQQQGRFSVMPNPFIQEFSPAARPSLPQAVEDDISLRNAKPGANPERYGWYHSFLRSYAENSEQDDSMI